MRGLWLFLFLLAQLCLAANESYIVLFEGVNSEELKQEIQNHSQLKLLEKRPPSHFFSLKCRAESDIPNLLNVLHAYGYFDASVNFQFLGDFPCTEVCVSIYEGVPYSFGSFKIIDEQGCESDLFNSLNKESFELQVCRNATTQAILLTEENLLKQLDLIGFPFATVCEKQIIVDKEAKQVYVTFIVKTGHKAYFGPVQISGLSTVDQEFILKRTLWNEGDYYDPNKIKKTDAYLQESGLFSEVVVMPADEMNEEGCLPINISVSELKHRHLGAGFTFSTDESLGFIFQWDHENLYHQGENLAFTAEASGVIQKASLEYCVPDFCCPYQNLVYTTEIKREDTRGFLDREGSFKAEVIRQIGKRLDFSYGLKIEKLLSTHSDNNQNYNLISLPLYVHWNRSNDLWNPTKGSQFCYKLTPYQNFFSTNIFFLKQEFCLALYFPIWNENCILATSCQVGSITGQSRLNIPAPKRFYAGSACDLRGYAYKTVSPLEGTKPVGGRSYLIFQVEPRIKVAKKLYLVTFFDCGNVYSQAIPNFDEILRRSFGLGMRYLTGLGPLRFDIAFPLDRRKDIDSSFQIYASIGQTF